MGICAFSAAEGCFGFVFYPAIKAESPGALGVIGLAAYFLLILIPFIIETEVKLKWKYLKSGI
jgi:energy-coupling factor transport system permease protein